MSEITFEYELCQHIYKMWNAKRTNKNYTLSIMDAKSQILDDAPVFQNDTIEISKRLDEALRLVEIVEKHSEAFGRFLNYHTGNDEFL